MPDPAQPPHPKKRSLWEQLRERFVSPPTPTGAPPPPTTQTPAPAPDPYEQEAERLLRGERDYEAEAEALLAGKDAPAPAPAAQPQQPDPRAVAAAAEYARARSSGDLMGQLGALLDGGETTVLFDKAGARAMTPDEKAAEARRVEEGSARRAREAALLDALGEAAKRGLTRKQLEATYDFKNPEDVSEFIENAGAARESRLDVLRHEDPGWLARGISDVVEGMTAGKVDLAKAGEVLRGGTGEATDLARAEQGTGGRLMRAVLQTTGAAMTTGAASKGLQALGTGARTANVAGMAGYGAASAEPGERLEGAATMAALGLGGGMIEQQLVKVLPRLPVRLRAIGASSGGNVLAGYLLGQDSTEEVLTNAVLGAVMRAVDARPDVTEADLRKEALAAAKFHRAKMQGARTERNARVAEDVDRRIAGIDERNAIEADLRRNMPVAALPAGESARPALPGGDGEPMIVTVAPEPPPPPGYAAALEWLRGASPGVPGYSTARPNAIAALHKLTVAELRAEAKALGLRVHSGANKAMLASEIATAAERQALQERGLYPGSRGTPDLEPRPPVITAEQAGVVKARAVAAGLAAPEEVYSPERVEVAETGRALGLSDADVRAAVEAIPVETRPDGTIAAGYKPTEQALAEGLIEEAAVPAVRMAKQRGIATVSSGTTPDGRGFAIGVDAQGHVRRVEAPAPQAAPIQPEGRQSERGFASFPRLKQAWDGAARFVRGFMGAEITRVADQGGPAASEAARKARHAVDLTKRALGDMAPELDAALKAAGGLGFARTKAAWSVARPFREQGNQRAMYLPFIEMIEGRREPANDAERAIRDAGQALILKRGELYEAAGVMQEGPEGPRYFQNRPKIAPRVFSGEWEDFVRRTPTNSAEWNAAVEAWTEATGATPQRIDALLREMRAGLSDVLPPSATRQAQVEMVREFRRIPHAIRMPALGRTVHVLDPSPARYFRSLAERGAARLGVIRAFGQDIGALRPVQELRERVAEETGDGRPFLRMMRALHNTTPGAAGVASPGGPAAMLARGFTSVMGTAKNLAQGMSFFTNIPENLGTVRSKVGTASFLRATARLFAAPFHKLLGRRAVLEALEVQGKITKNVLDVSVDPSRPASSAFRILNRIIERVPFHGHFMNEINERWAALAFEDFVQGKMRTGKGFGRSYVALRALGYSDADSLRLARGHGKTGEYDRVVRELVGTATGSNLAKAERSILENSRLWNQAQWFTNWAFMRARSAANFGRAYIQSMEKAWTAEGLSTKERWNLAVEAQRRLASGVTGVYVTGTATKLLAALVTGGTTGLAQAWHDTKEDVAGSALDAIKYALIGGPLAVAWRAVEERGETTPADYLAPVSVLQNVVDFAAGKGTYDNKPAAERWRLFLRRTAPATKGYQTMLVALGLGNPDEHEMQTALSLYYRWRRENIPSGAPGTEGYESAETERWRTNMRAAYNAMVKGATPEEVEEHVYRAMGLREKSARDVKDAILARRLLVLSGIPREERKPWLDKLRRDLAPEVMSLIESHDALLVRLAKSLGSAVGQEPGRLADKLREKEREATAR